nr:hypothetical protein [Sodalis-like endosymbiont of Proechinophthirus fluctus]
MPGSGMVDLAALIMLLVMAVGVVLAHSTCFVHNVYAMGMGIIVTLFMCCRVS